MASLFFPQLSTGSLAQYPIRKTRVVRTLKNVLPDGSMYLLPDSNAGHIIWQLEYVELSAVEIAQLQNLFDSCAGPLRAFTFMDPTDNLFSWSADPTQPVWNLGRDVQLSAGMPDAFGGTGAFAITNNSQVPAGLSQVLSIPANYQYCFSAYVRSDQQANVTLTLAGSTAADSFTQPATSLWQRVVFAGQLNDAASSLSASLSIAPGQQLQVCGLQLEAQPAASSYRTTGQGGGVYTNAHWGVDQLPVVATYPGQFATAFSIEARV